MDLFDRAKEYLGDTIDETLDNTEGDFQTALEQRARTAAGLPPPTTTETQVKAQATIIPVTERPTAPLSQETINNLMIGGAIVALAGLVYMFKKRGKKGGK